MSASLPVIAGISSTAIFAGSTLPMLAKALRTRDLASYSLGNLLLANVGNAVHTVYVLSLPVGPVWAMHGFNVVVSATMLAWFVRYELWRRRGSAALEAAGVVRAPATPVDPLAACVEEPRGVAVIVPDELADVAVVAPVEVGA